MKRVFVPVMAAAMVLGMTACGGASYSEGRIGDTMETYFFDFTVNSACLATEYGDRVPAPGNALLVAEITVKNTYRESIEMYDTDFQLTWGDETGDYCYPITTDPETYEELEPVDADQLPGTYLMAVDETRTGALVYEVPAGQADFSIAYLEMFDDGTAEGDTGDSYFVYFTARESVAAL